MVVVGEPPDYLPPCSFTAYGLLLNSHDVCCFGWTDIDRTTNLPSTLPFTTCLCLPAFYKQLPNFLLFPILPSWIGSLQLYPHYLTYHCYILFLLFYACSDLTFSFTLLFWTVSGRCGITTIPHLPLGEFADYYF